MASMKRKHLHAGTRAKRFLRLCATLCAVAFALSACAGKSADGVGETNGTGGLSEAAGTGGIPSATADVAAAAASTPTEAPATPASTETPITPASITLPTPVDPHTPPIGDAGLKTARDVTIYLPRGDGARLTAVSARITTACTRHPAEDTLRELLSHPGTTYALPLSQAGLLQLSGMNPVEISRDVATVNLSAAALQLDREEFYLVCQAIANTLTEYSDIQYVNVQVAGRQVGLDLASTLPTGSFQRHVGEDVGALFEQALSGMTQDAGALHRITETVTLYLPTAARTGLMTEARNVTFDNASSAHMVLRVLQELSASAGQQDGLIALPPLMEQLQKAPEFAALQSGGRKLTLSFRASLDTALAERGLSREQCFAAITCTLATFFPNLTGIEALVGGERVEALGAARFEDGLLKRDGFAGELLDECVLYFADAEGLRLNAVRRAVPAQSARSPRALLLELAKGPLAGDSAPDGVLPVLSDALRDADILGIAIEDDTLLVHFAGGFLTQNGGVTGEKDRLMAFALVNTLCACQPVSRVRFYAAGGAFDGFTPEIYWRGAFTLNPGIVSYPAR